MKLAVSIGEEPLRAYSLIQAKTLVPRVLVNIGRLAKNLHSC